MHRQRASDVQSSPVYLVYGHDGLGTSDRIDPAFTVVAQSIRDGHDAATSKRPRVIPCWWCRHAR